MMIIPYSDQQRAVFSPTPQGQPARSQPPDPPLSGWRLPKIHIHPTCFASLHGQGLANGGCHVHALTDPFRDTRGFTIEVTFRVTLASCLRRCPGPSRSRSTSPGTTSSRMKSKKVLYGRPRYIAPGRTGNRLVFGATAAGRLLLVVVAEPPDGGVDIVTARPMTDTEVKTFRKKGS